MSSSIIDSTMQSIGFIAAIHYYPVYIMKKVNIMGHAKVIIPVSVSLLLIQVFQVKLKDNSLFIRAEECRHGPSSSIYGKKSKSI